jgi:hypothetical protein
VARDEFAQIELATGVVDIDFDQVAVVYQRMIWNLVRSYAQSHS